MIGVLTYNVPHRKTYDALCLLKAKGYMDVAVYAVPLHYQKKYNPYYKHRPEMNLKIETALVCKNFGYRYIEIENYDEIDIDKGSIMLICGAGILPDNFIRKNRIINAHPGYIPNCRGLDALKWAIYEKQIIGVTSHLIGDEIDAGDILIRKEIPVYKNDTFHAVAQRVYEQEISILIESIEQLLNYGVQQHIKGENYMVHKRMPLEIDKDLLNYFEEYKRENAI